MSLLVLILIYEKQEKKIINDLEKQNILRVILSNRVASKTPGLGIFGKTYCPLISDYLKKTL